MTICFQELVSLVKSLMAKWLEQAWQEMCCHDLEVMSSNPGRVELGVHGTAILSRTWIKILIASASVYLRARAFEITSDL